MERLFIFFVLLLVSPAFASPIMMDQFILEGKPFPLRQSLFGSYFSSKGLSAERIFSRKCAEEPRGYQATWEAKKGFLFLIAIEETVCKGHLLPRKLSDIFPAVDEGPVNADWFSGTLYVELGWGFHHEGELETTHFNFQALEVKEGKVIGSKYWEDHWTKPQ